MGIGRLREVQNRQMQPPSEKKQRLPKPAWLTKRLPVGGTHEKVKALLRQVSLHTVCEEARCPNLAECFSRRTATVLILGDRCTRRCRFCAVQHGVPVPPSPDEPPRVAELVSQLQLLYVVITSVTRDDLPDGGAGHFAETVRQVRLRVPSARLEVLIPDFQGSAEALDTVLESEPEVLNHNLETVRRLAPVVRPEADYRRSLELLARTRTRRAAILTKSGLMLGMGERQEEVRSALEDLLESGCRILTLGQYLQPTARHHPVERYVPPEEFEEWAAYARSRGFLEAASGPFVRSSYRAGELYRSARGEGSHQERGGSMQSAEPSKPTLCRDGNLTQR